jgi:hypothetical protein
LLKEFSLKCAAAEQYEFHILTKVLEIEEQIPGLVLPQRLHARFRRETSTAKPS